jgi:hypothetical protein
MRLHMGCLLHMVAEGELKVRREVVGVVIKKKEEEIIKKVFDLVVIPST